MTAPARRPVGRPSKLRPEVVERLLAAVKSGATVQAACMHAGIGASTLYAWLEKAAATDDDGNPLPDHQEYRQFQEQLDRARAELQVDVLSSVMEAIKGGALLKRVTRYNREGEPETEEQFAPPDGRLGLDFLSRLFPADFARRNAVEVTGAGGGPVEIAGTVQQLSRVAAVVAKALADQAEPVDAEVVDDGQAA